MAGEALTLQQFQQLCPRASRDTIAANIETGAIRLSYAKPERHSSQTLELGVSGKEESTQRARISVVRFACRLLDEDNLKGGIKPLLDCIKEAGLIEDDSPDKIELDVRQEQVWNKDQKRTEVKITWLN